MSLPRDDFNFIPSYHINHYAVLGLKGIEDQKTIIKTIKRLLLVNHPDKKRSASEEEQKKAEEITKQITAAKEILTTDTRISYDEYLKAHRFPPFDSDEINIAEDQKALIIYIKNQDILSILRLALIYGNHPKRLSVFSDNLIGIINDDEALQAALCKKLHDEILTCNSELAKVSSISTKEKSQLAKVYSILTKEKQDSLLKYGPEHSSLMLKNIIIQALSLTQCFKNSNTFAKYLTEVSGQIALVKAEAKPIEVKEEKSYFLSLKEKLANHLIEIETKNLDSKADVGKYKFKKIFEELETEFNNFKTIMESGRSLEATEYQINSVVSRFQILTTYIEPITKQMTEEDRIDYILDFKDSYNKSRWKRLIEMAISYRNCEAPYQNLNNVAMGTLGLLKTLFDGLTITSQSSWSFFTEKDPRRSEAFQIFTDCRKLLINFKPHYQYYPDQAPVLAAGKP